MKLTAEKIRTLTQGAAQVVCNNGKIQFHRFSEQERKIICNNPNALCTAGVQIEFKTDGCGLILKGETQKAIPERSLFSIDILINNKLDNKITNIDCDECEGNYSERNYVLGEFCTEVIFKNNPKIVRIVLPYSVITYIEEIEVIDATYVEPVKRKNKIVAYGDSITQGYDALHSYKTYAMQLADALDAELINKSLGSGVFSPELVSDMLVDEDVNFVIVAYGTNDRDVFSQSVFEERARNFIDLLLKKYTCASVLVLSPIWRGDHNEPVKEFGSFSCVEQILKRVCETYKKIKFVSGWNLVPHKEGYFGDLRLHPNDNGFDSYFENLIGYF